MEANHVHIEEAYTIINDHLFNSPNKFINSLHIKNLTYEASKQLEEDGYNLIFEELHSLFRGYWVLFF